MTAEIEDTYAEAFRSLCVEFIITARNRRWLDHAVAAATGHGSSTIMCDCEAGVDRYTGPDSETGEPTPDGRPGAVCQLHVPKFWKNAERALEKALLSRVSQNVLTCPTARCFSPDPEAQDSVFRLGRKVAYFGDRFEELRDCFGRRMWWIPTMGGDFVIDRRFPFGPGVMGGNLWFLAESEDASLEAAERAVDACRAVPGVITPFPGGVAGSGSKAGSSYSFLFAGTNEPFCPKLRDNPAAESRLPQGIVSAMEIIINGRDAQSIQEAVLRSIESARDVPGLRTITAGNYGGRLGKTRILLCPPEGGTKE